MLEHMKAQKQIHKRFAFQILLEVSACIATQLLLSGSQPLHLLPDLQLLPAMKSGWGGLRISSVSAVFSSHVTTCSLEDLQKPPIMWQELM